MNVASATVQATIIATETGSGGIGSRSNQLAYQKTYALTNGTAANQVNEVFDDSRTLAASANETLVVTGGALVDAFGTAVNATAIKSLYIENTSTTGSLKVGLAANPFLGPMGGTAPFQTVPPGQYLHWPNFTAAGWAVTGGSNDGIKLLNLDGSNALTYKIIIMFNQ